MFISTSAQWHWHGPASTPFHASTIAFNPRKRLLLCSTRPKPPSRRTRIPRGKTPFNLFRRRARSCRMFAGQNTVRTRGSRLYEKGCPTVISLFSSFYYVACWRRWTQKWRARNPSGRSRVWSPSTASSRRWHRWNMNLVGTPTRFSI
jgi:hypothetical protein